MSTYSNPTSLLILVEM